MFNQIYSVSKSGSFLDKLSLAKRKVMYQIFLNEFSPNPENSILDVGVTADADALASNYFEQLYPYKNKIIALSNQNAQFLGEIYPGLTFQPGDAKELPFGDHTIDIIFSSAVIEHIGSLENQEKMIAECVRVANKGVFITTPNRWHPLELHTFLPFLHWLPKPFYRKILKLIGLKFYAAEENLNLLDRASLSYICHKLKIKNFSVKSIRTFGIVSNLILVIKFQ